METDQQIQQDVLRELGWESHVRCADVGVTVRSGVVTLTGTVGSWAEKCAAQRAAHRVRGVLDIANDMIIKPSWNDEKSDTDIAQAVRGALEWNVYVPETIKSDVWEGVVTLSGVAESLQTREDAEKAVRSLKGVRGIENHIVVEPPSVSPTALRGSIENALMRHVSREANKISIDVRGDTVVISGVVDSWAERRAVLGAAIGTRGVRSVDDQLHVRSPIG
jgi:osmotically-inducible protein OsmY